MVNHLKDKNGTMLIIPLHLLQFQWQKCKRRI
jgi:hypothetical protein